MMMYCFLRTRTILLLVAFLLPALLGGSSTKTVTFHSKLVNPRFEGVNRLKFVMPNAGICSMAGAFSCSITHAAVVPLDVIKTKMQTDASFAQFSTLKAAQQLVSNKGGAGLLLQGLSATFVGYFLQGACKFGLFDCFKGYLFSGPESNKEAVQANSKIPFLVAASSCAEAVACFTLTPLERTRIQMVVNKNKVGMLDCMKSIISQSGIKGLWLGLGPIMMKQIPYTAVKLSGYELISQPIRTLIHNSNRFTDHQETLLTGLSAGVCAGIAAAIISQPADVLLSKVCGGGTSMLSECIIVDGIPGLIHAMKGIGLKNSFAGVRQRAMMVGALTAGQMVLYESAKNQLSLTFQENDST
mmetsp:Transcript_34260/g.43234  ORF Transcript_34260/g.43234 Transcript_34260/m.43234 type:complete len:357 (-) Transcript_34260:47-1117(-)